MTRPWHPSDGPPKTLQDELSVDHPWDDLIADAASTIGQQRADCCVGRAAYRVIVPPSRNRPRATRLLLCSHHFRASRTGLAHACVDVYNSCDRLVFSSRHS